MVNSCLVDHVVLLVHLLPVDHSLTEDLDPLLRHRETRILSCELFHHAVEVLVFGELLRKHFVSLSQLVGELNQLVTKLPELGAPAEDIVQVVEHNVDALLLVSILQLNQF